MRFFHGRFTFYVHFFSLFFSFQFQARGTPHVHSLICISNKDGITNNSIESIDETERNKVIQYTTSILSANLVRSSSEIDRDFIEDQYNWCPPKDYFSDERHPCRSSFNSDWNYDRNSDGVFADTNVRAQYRSLQIASQCHRCCFTCFKYCHKHEKICRFGYPWVSQDCLFGPIIVKNRDKRSRIKISVLPQRNNAYVNCTLFDPLLTIALGGNHDIQYISNTVGAAEYVASYASKSEAPDRKILSNIFNKKLAYLSSKAAHVTDRERLYSVGCAILGSSPVGSVQACYSLLGLKFVKSSRVVVNVNPLHRKFVEYFYNQC